MARANAAYYAGRDPFADFVTAPEISQIFGELLGAWSAVVGREVLAGAAGSCSGLLLVEAGPGRGTLMADMLRVLSRVAPDLMAGLSVHLVETSPRLRAAQKAALEPSGVPVFWHDGLESVPRGPMVLVANEFLDALPVRQFVGETTGWRERFVRDGAFVLSDMIDPPAELAGREVETGEVAEICPAACVFVRDVAERLCVGPGVALFVDYGTAVTASGESLQALQDGQPVSPLVKPGTADLTAHVDFEAVARAAMATGARCFGPVEQGELLVALGAVERARVLCDAEPDQAGMVRTALGRLIAPERMGRLFKALAVVSPSRLAPGLVAPPGFPEGTAYDREGAG
ncbi:class I SAM-dependent methyltransferase [Acetobacter oeni]|uniref:ATP synthase subunit beta n=1 Tax=Acetobacter oeni TaxID=304077 RepID=A0A511XGV6_9PROT|nr:SAM-dependent methyltransferase [Acetobacter oeni]MBB3882318.1 SAM-dependent MidA family methyltransferase [Acetobacter oeni]NHO18577.1 class I SAM-dependent methyltransferase [Acetobacter oeni]GBR02206.1 hypothetical protein AA21952_0670 [Acetobacter oeni LMG 21952]GEN62180.1 ATP synthase subunit beta [Acetobacter oeni]